LFLHKGKVNCSGNSSSSSSFFFLTPFCVVYIPLFLFVFVVNSASIFKRLPFFAMLSVCSRALQLKTKLRRSVYHLVHSARSSSSTFALHRSVSTLISSRSAVRNRTHFPAVKPLSAANMSTNISVRLHEAVLNDKVVRAEYAVRGEIVIKAMAYKKQLKQDAKDLSFDEVIECNIGNPQALGQKPLTWIRQVLALVTYPDMLDDPVLAAQFPEDVKERARKYMTAIPGGTGAYSNSKGVEVVRQEVAQYIQERDGHAAEVGNIFLTDGASPGVKAMLQLLIRDHTDGILVPIPQYPLYSASITLQGGSLVSYELDESKGWSMSVDELRRSYKEATENGINVRALVVINPGNPTGQCLPADNMADIARFCEENSLVLMADEVYQTNIYGTTPFTSFKKVICDIKSPIELVSYHSVSKGFVGECGRRGGYMELHNFDPIVVDQLYKVASVSLCSNLDGQISVSLVLFCVVLPAIFYFFFLILIVSDTASFLCEPCLFGFVNPLSVPRLV
jgi:aspartate/methionine/tyrosine aminotransferase